MVLSRFLLEKMWYLVNAACMYKCGWIIVTSELVCECGKLVTLRQSNTALFLTPVLCRGFISRNINCIFPIIFQINLLDTRLAFVCCLWHLGLSGQCYRAFAYLQDKVYDWVTEAPLQGNTDGVKSFWHFNHGRFCSCPSSVIKKKSFVMLPLGREINKPHQLLQTKLASNIPSVDTSLYNKPFFYC